MRCGRSDGDGGGSGAHGAHHPGVPEAALVRVWPADFAKCGESEYRWGGDVAVAPEDRVLAWLAVRFSMEEACGCHAVISVSHVQTQAQVCIHGGSQQTSQVPSSPG